MPALAVADVTVALASGNAYPKLDVNIEGRKRRVNVKITFGDGVKTYTPGGIPLPGPNGFGLLRNLDNLILTDPSNADALMYKWDKTDNTLHIFNPGAELGGVAVAATTLYAEAVGW